MSTQLLFYANATPLNPKKHRGLRVIDRNTLKRLDAETLHGLMSGDELELIYLHLHSLPNLRVIGERMPLHPAEDTAPAVDTAPGEDTASAVGETKDPRLH